jgi:hypothetical protein
MYGRHPQRNGGTFSTNHAFGYVALLNKEYARLGTVPEGPH